MSPSSASSPEPSAATGGRTSSRPRSAVVIVFLFAILCLYRPSMLWGDFSCVVSIFTPGAYGLLAAALLLPFWRHFRSRAANPGKGVLFQSCMILLILASSFSAWSANGTSACVFFIVFFADEFRGELKKYLPKLMCVIFFLDILVALKYYMDDRITAAVGIPGNWNWSALLLVICFPFIICELKRILSGRLFIAASAITSALLLLMLAISHSRAAWMALFAASLALAFAVFSKLRNRRLVLSALLCAAVCVSVFFITASDSAAGFIGREIRVQVWESTVGLIKDHPLGSGAFGYENAIIPYKTAAYFFNPHSALRTTHPHNEILYIASAFGVFAALAWLAFIVNGFRMFYSRPCGEIKEDAFSAAVIFAFAAVLTASMFDMAFAAWPTAQLGFLLAGLAMFPASGADGTSAGELTLSRKILLAAASAFIGALALLSCAATLYGTYFCDRAGIAYASGDAEAGRNAALRAAPHLLPDSPAMLYSLAGHAAEAGDHPAVLEFSKYFAKSPYPDFMHVHGLRANAFMAMGYPAFAIPEYISEIKCYPYTVIPRIGLAAAYDAEGRKNEAEEVRAGLDRLMKLRSLDGDSMKQIFANPALDTEDRNIIRGRIK